MSSREKIITYDFANNVRLKKYMSKKDNSNSSAISFRNIKKDMFINMTNTNIKQNDNLQKTFLNQPNINIYNTSSNLIEKMNSPNISLRTKDKISEILSINNQLSYYNTKREK